MSKEISSKIDQKELIFSEIFEGKIVAEFDDFTLKIDGFEGFWVFLEKKFFITKIIFKHCYQGYWRKNFYHQKISIFSLLFRALKQKFAKKR